MKTNNWSNFFPPNWTESLADILQSEPCLALENFLEREYLEQVVFPPKEQIFIAFSGISPEEVKVVILGQDPYHGPGQAHGLAFSVTGSQKLPPSLKNIFKELHHDLGIPMPTQGDLSPWAKQGVLLLNTCLTVRRDQPGSHKGKGWEFFSDAVIKKLSDMNDSMVFLLWGQHAISKAPIINAHKHLVLTAAHPSPLSAYHGFFGCKHFSKCNAFLQRKGRDEICWELP